MTYPVHLNPWWSSSDLRSIFSDKDTEKENLTLLQEGNVIEL
jgi:hypothetical protein